MRNRNGGSSAFHDGVVCGLYKKLVSTMVLHGLWWMLPLTVAGHRLRDNQEWSAREERNEKWMNEAHH